jgi:AmmeMemoRadiSam system protein B
MESDAKTPRFRPLTIFPHEVEGRRVLALKDAEGITERMAMLPPPLVPFLLEMFDGRHTLDQVREEYHRRSGGDRIPEGDLEMLIEQLDEALLLDTPRFRDHYRSLLSEWQRLETRPAMHAGQAYPAEPEQLVTFLDAFYDGVESPRSPSPLAAVAVPHLDLRSGGPTAARALAGLDRAFDGDTVVVLGVGHQHLSQPFALSPKDLSTPLGPLPVNDDLYHRIVEKAGSWILDDEFSHRNEHSIEFAAVLLKHALGDRELSVVPVLCGSLHHLLGSGLPPRDDPRIGAFLETLEEEIGDALLYASVDLAHMGPYYGDDALLTEDDLERVGREDRVALDRLAARDGAGFFAHFEKDGDARRVCGMSALFTLAEILPPGPVGRLLGYEQTVFPEPGNTVTICAMAWDR